MNGVNIFDISSYTWYTIKIDSSDGALFTINFFYKTQDVYIDGTGNHKVKLRPLIKIVDVKSVIMNFIMIRMATHAYPNK